MRAGVVGGSLGLPIFLRQILSDTDIIFQWHKFKFQNRGEMMHPTKESMIHQLRISTSHHESFCNCLRGGAADPAPPGYTLNLLKSNVSGYLSYGKN